MESRRIPMPYFMAYPSPEENNNSTRESDREYFKQIYPKEIKQYIRIITEVLDRMDIRESYIYDEYPDKIRLERLSEVILRLIPVEKNMNRNTQKNLIKVLLSNEIIERRERKRQ